MAPTAGRESWLDGTESSGTTPLETPTATPLATPISARSVRWEKDVEDAAAGALQRPLLYKRGTNTTSQMAIVGANTCPIESLDYEIVENDVYNQDWRSRGKLQIFQYQVLKWVLALLVGVVVGLVGFFSNIAVENIAGFKLLLTGDLMLQNRYLAAFELYIGCNAVLAAAAAALCAYVAPAAAGSGIPEVKAYLNGIDAHSILAPSTLLVKILGSVLGVSAGFVLGKEGPMVHTGSCVASLLAQGGSRKYGLTWNWIRYFKNDLDRRDLITCGAAAGVAAAFRAPVGGVLFALEEVTSWWRSALLWRTFSTTAVATMVLHALITYCRGGHCGLFGKGGLIMFDLSSRQATYTATDLAAVVLLAVLGGLLGALFNFLVDRVLRAYSIVNEKGACYKIVLTVTISVITSCCTFGLPWLTACTPCPPELASKCPTIGRSGNFKNFQCPPGQYNALASLFFNTNDDAIRNLFSAGYDREFGVSTLLTFFTTVYTLGLLTYGVAVPSGLFIPVILSGASFGRLAGTLLGSVSGLDPGLFALLGAAAFLGGTMRMTVSVCVILLELTNDLLLLPLIMLVLLIAKTVADCFNKGVYEQIVRMKGLPYLEVHAEPCTRSLVAGDVVSGPLVTFSSVERVGTVVHTLRSTGHNGFPVIEDPPFAPAPELCGLVLRSHLLVLLQGRIFTSDRVKTGAAEVFRRLAPFDFAKAGSGKGIKVDDLDLTEEEMDMYMDLHPITNRSPYTVVENMSLAKAAVLFRGLGLRHMCVLPRTQGVSMPVDTFVSSYVRAFRCITHV
ncbi:chloride channel protein CLC-c isoform X1 [Zea mays]|uniref:chloride channel protein CLC-c isoform X1 n=1 Tax=Zea mays TaxID=4577 RepID=UPI0009AA62C7|nr:chloride channel protein CLC-c isoform X1 [Zea mays]XP_020405995.1 chloride channel protein CLC-c isoform X1 [Zea mays]|eukprot:XP_020405994.1 chloride channel protein CLC-c isoform X1 [Zea mays]